MPTPTAAVKVNPNTGALIDPPVATFCSANGIAQLSDLTSFFDYKGGQDCSGNPNYPAALKGDVYSVTVAGKIGGAIGVVVAVGDTFLATADNAGGTQAAVGTSWIVSQANIDLANIAITGGTINGTVIGGVSPSPGIFTALTCDTINGNTFIVGTGSIELTAGASLELYGNFGTTGAVTIDAAGGSATVFRTTAATDVTFPTSGTLLSTTAIGASVQAYDADLTTWAGITPGTGIATALAVATNAAGGFSPIDGTATLSNKTLTAPKFATGGFIADANGNELLIFTTTASAVNEITFANAATAGSPTFTASGSDTNISINLVPKGTGGVMLPDGLAATPALRFAADTNTGIWRSGADALDFTTGGVTKWQISSGGTLTSSYTYNVNAGIFQGSSGGVTQPTFTFGSSADTNTGMYRISEGVIGFTSDGVLQFSVGTAGVTVAGTLGVTGASTLTGNLTSNGAFISVPQAISGTGAITAINLTTLTTTIVTTGAATTTLAAGTSGQTKKISMITDGGDCVVTVTNASWGGATTATFANAFETLTLEYLNGKWVPSANYGPAGVGVVLA